MGSHFQQLVNKQLITDAPAFLNRAIQYEVIMGSFAYGVSNDSSDMDIYGFAIPPKEDLFPHLRGEILGFDSYETKFQHYQQHHIFDDAALGGKGRLYDVTLYSITKYFKLLMDNNPNIIDSLFVPENCIVHMTQLAEHIRSNRGIFLHKGCWLKFKGYAYGQIQKIRTKKPEGKRQSIVEKYGYDVKFAYHVVRLLSEVEQLLVEQNLDLSRNAEQLKSIRRGEWTIEQIEDYFTKKESELESVYLSSRLPDVPNVDAIRRLLVQCLEMYFGNIDKAVVQNDRATTALKDIKAILDSFG